MSTISTMLNKGQIIVRQSGGSMPRQVILAEGDCWVRVWYMGNHHNAIRYNPNYHISVRSFLRNQVPDWYDHTEVGQIIEVVNQIKEYLK